MRGLLARFRTPPAVADVTPEDPGLVVVASSFDPSASDVAVVEAALAGDGPCPDPHRPDPTRPVLVRHHVTGLPAVTGLTGPAAATAATAALAALGVLDPSYSVVVEGERVLVVRSERLDALSITRERTRMAGLAQRLGGEALGWDALQVPGPDAGAAGTPSGTAH